MASSAALSSHSLFVSPRFSAFQGSSKSLKFKNPNLPAIRYSTLCKFTSDLGFPGYASSTVSQRSIKPFLRADDSDFSSLDTAVSWLMMGSLMFSFVLPCSKSNLLMKIGAPVIGFSFYSRPLCPSLKFRTLGPKSGLNSRSSDNEEDQEASVQELRIPECWLFPSKARQESEWLRVTLHKWLDDEYCPEATNIEISKVAARSYYESLVGKQADLGEILLKMAGDLQSISYQESFHGAFSSANAAVHLIASRIEQK